MENKSFCLIDDEIFYNSNISNFGVSTKKIESPKKIFISFSPLSFNQKISFSNTIMNPLITIEPSMETKKNLNQSKFSQKNTRIKTESSKDENNNMSIEKQETKSLIENDLNEIVANTNVIDINNLDVKESLNNLERNPYFFGKKNTFDITKYNNNNNSKIEEKKVKHFLKKKKTKNQIINENERKTIKHSRRQSCNLIRQNQNKIKNNMKRMESLQINKLNFIEKEDTEKKYRKNKIRKKTSAENTYEIYNMRLSDKNLPVQNYKISPKRNSHRIKREKTVITKPSLFKDKKMKAYLHNRNSSTNLKNKEKNNRDKRGTLIFRGTSHKFLLRESELELGNKEENQLKETNEEKEEERSTNSSKKNSHKKSYDLNHFNSKTKKIKTTSNLNDDKTENEKIKINILRKKLSKPIKKINFELALKNKNNLGKTQFNLFSPDKFTNTEFCDSDYCEYTLNCMDLILNGNASKKQEKSKINFNFPKTQGKIQKKIALFDLDETLVHCTGDINISTEPYQHCIDVVLPGNKKTKVGINIRPLWKKTLNLIKRNYHIVIFTASHQAYADAVLNFMDPNNKYFKYRLYRNNCSLVDVDGVKFYVKDLDIFDEYYDLKDIVIIDNSVLSFLYHFGNGIPIVPYYNEDKDGSLYVVGLYLMHIFKENDLREANKKYINLESFLNEAKLRNDIEKLNNKIKNDVNMLNQNIKEKEENNNNKNKINIVEEEGINLKNISNPRRCSYSIENTQYKLISRSRLINMYYEIKNNNRTFSDKNIKEVAEEKSDKSDKSFSVEDEEEIKEDECKENIGELFFRKKLLTTGDEPDKEKRNFKSYKELNNYFDIKMIRSNFYNNFSK